MKYPCPECSGSKPSQTVCWKCGGAGVLDDRAPPKPWLLLDAEHADDVCGKATPLSTRRFTAKVMRVEPTFCGKADVS